MSALPVLSHRARITPASPIRSLSGLARQARDRGVEVFHLNIGQPDIPSPVEFYEGLRQYQRKVVAYEQSEGNLELRERWTALLNHELGIDLTPAEMLITTGASEALIFLFMTCCDPGDEIIAFDPTYANYMGFAAITGVTLQPVATHLHEQFQLPDIKIIEQRINSKTRALLLCSPNNPTGTVYRQDQLKQLIELCERRNIFFLVDETYRELVFDNHKPLSVLSLAPQSKHIAVVDSLSKRFSLCGARIGSLISRNQELMEKSVRLAQARLAAPSIEQSAAATMLSSIGGEYLERARAEYQRRRDVLCEAFLKIKGVHISRPSGAFYALLQLPVRDAAAFARFLLQEFQHQGKTVFLAPASGFYLQDNEGIDQVRVAFVLEPAKLLEAAELVEIALKNFQARSSS